MEGAVQTIYLAGPMTGIPDFNFPAFKLAAATLRALGFEVFNPAEFDEAEGFFPGTDIEVASVTPGAKQSYMARDFPFVLAADAIVLLDGWETSSGCAAELFVARVVGKAIYAFDVSYGLLPMDDYVPSPKLLGEAMGAELVY